ncbi:MAG: MmcQ/YjbR family DNA-binding protein [Limosilactobacillus sp.]|uniref:MmcQ/YjbR family DNA-binding protein n=1 Tax=Limosilactobacillus sp. TaxID=2773925 RepID=UPI00270ADEFA|nr:MmcQ/YjbR family DNA-binding protein [Limosilactobacillus sp.]
MDRETLISYIKDEYDVIPEALWEKWPRHVVFRHYDTKKWFGIMVEIPANKIGIDSDQIIDVLNVKLDPADVDLLVSEHIKGFYPAYHMNKKYWISLNLSELSDDQIKKALAQSFDNTHK